MDFPSTTLRAGSPSARFRAGKYDMKYRVGREVENEEVVSRRGWLKPLAPSTALRACFRRSTGREITRNVMNLVGNASG